MQGAYLLWDRLLLSLCDRQPGYLQTLLETFFTALVRHTSNQQPEKDTHKEATYLWLLHIAMSRDWTKLYRLNAFDVPSWLARQCCLQPGYWSYKLGKTMLEHCGNDFADTWSEVLDASAVNAETGGPEVQMRDVSESHETLEPPSDGVVDDAIGWRIALMPSSTPIGVVW